MDRLNADCLLKIFSQLNITEKVQIETVCRRWYTVLQRYDAFNNIDTLDISTFLLYSTAEYYQQDNLNFEPMVIGLVSRVGPYLKNFSFGHSWERIGQPIIDALTEHCTQLKNINFGATIMNASLDRLLDSVAPQLESLSLGDTGWIEAQNRANIQKHVSRLRRIRELNLRNALINLDCIEELPDGLKSLDISGIGSISISALKRFFEKHKNLQKLIMSPLPQNLRFNTFIGDENTETAASLQKAINALGVNGKALQTLKLGYISHAIGNLSLEPLAQLTNLRELTLESCQCLTHETLKLLAQSVPNLGALKIRDCPKVTDYGAVANMKGLIELHVDKTVQLCDEDLEAIAAQGRLKVLRTIECINVTTKGINAVIQQCPLIELDVTKCINIGDSCLRTLVETPNRCHLRILTLNSCPYITGKGLAHLAHSPKTLAALRQLDVTRAKYIVNDTVLQLHSTLRNFWDEDIVSEDVRFHTMPIHNSKTNLIMGQFQPLVCYCSHSSITPDIEKTVSSTIELVF